MRHLLTHDYPDADTIVLVFEPVTAFALAQRLDRRIADIDTLNTELAAWQHATNTDQRQVNWQFTTANARTKLRHPYPNN